MTSRFERFELGPRDRFVCAACGRYIGAGDVFTIDWPTEAARITRDHRARGLEAPALARLMERWTPSRHHPARHDPRLPCGPVYIRRR